MLQSPQTGIMSQRTITLASYNILHPGLAVAMGTPQGITRMPEGNIASNWYERAPQIADNLEGADIVCLQESSPHCAERLTGKFSVLAHAMHRFHNGTAAHGTALLTAKGQPRPLLVFNWLAPGRRGRNACCAIFKLPDNGPRLLVASVHPDGYWEGEPRDLRFTRKRYKGYRELASYIHRAQPYKQHVDAIVIAGDINEHYMPRGNTHNRHVLLGLNGYQDDHHLVTTEPSTGRKLDWIYVWSRRSVELQPVYEDARFPNASDHLPVKTKLVFE